MTGETGAEIAAAVNSGKTVYLGPGEYTFSQTLKNGCVYGAGTDETILNFSTLDVCTETPIRLFNLTIDGGKFGYVQTSGPDVGIDAANVRFANQSSAGMTLGNARNAKLNFLEFDNCGHGIGTCMGDIQCDEGMVIDELSVYGSTFKNLTNGAVLHGGTRGFMSFVGCRFENIATTALSMHSKGNYITDCDFLNCGIAAFGKHSLTVHNCSVQGGDGSEGFRGVHETMTCYIRGCQPAVQVATDFAIVSDIDAKDGGIDLRKNTWISHSIFCNIDAVNGAYIGETDLSDYVDKSPVLIDQTGPTAPGDLQVTRDDDHNVLTWTGSEDPESKVMQYIIERNGAEIGRPTGTIRPTFTISFQTTGRTVIPGPACTGILQRATSTRGPPPNTRLRTIPWSRSITPRFVPTAKWPNYGFGSTVSLPTGFSERKQAIPPGRNLAIASMYRLDHLP